MSEYLREEGCYEVLRKECWRDTYPLKLIVTAVETPLRASS